MRNIKVTLSYVGTNYCGYQIQPEGIPTVSQAFQRAAEQVFHRKCDVKGASRTDAGVHARGFVVSLRCEGNISCESLVRALNVHLPPDIAVLSCEEMPEQFHPRYDCVGKRYLYRLYNRPVRDPFREKTDWFYPWPLDVGLLNRAAEQLEGTHDFSSFCGSNGDPPDDRVRTIYRCRAYEKNGRVVIAVTGDGFLYNMVRILVGTLTSVCAGKRTPESLPALLAAKDRTLAGMTAPAHGLYLDRVFYSAAALESALEREPQEILDWI